MNGKPAPAGVLIVGIFNLLGGLILTLTGMIISYILFVEIGDIALAQTAIEELIGPSPLSQIALAIGPILTVAGIFFVVVGVGLVKGKPWARTAAIIYYAIILVSGFLFLPSGLVTVVIAGLVIYYLFTSGVKVFFGKAQIVESKRSAVPPVQVVAPPPPPPEERTKYCGSCGTEMSAEALYCPECGERQ